MLLRRLYDDTIAQASYIIGCDETRQAIVVDPNRDIDRYVALAKSEKLTITQVTETHIHADFVSGARMLATAAGAELCLSGEGGTDWQYGFGKSDRARLLHDGDVIDVGKVRIVVMHTPGHTPEHISFVVTDTATSTNAMGMLSGDFIFVGDVGRPDLLERAAGLGNTMEVLARQLHASLQKTTSLPDFLQIWPGHGAGSACGKALGDVPSSTLGYERLVNWAFQAKDEKTFVDEVLAGQPEPPKYFARMKSVNRDGPTARVVAATVPRLLAGDFIARMNSATVVDVRSTADFASGHIPGTLNIPTGTSFPNWFGSLIDPARPVLLLIGVDESRLARALTGAALVGMDNIAGWGGPDVIGAWTSSGKTLMKTEQLDAGQANDSGRVIVDVRGKSERDHESIPGAHPAFLGDLLAQMSTIDKDTALVLHCGSGSRSAIAASLLQAHGFTDVANMRGGIGAWTAAGLPVEHSSS